MTNSLENKYNDAIWVAGALFNKGLVTGSTGNISFLHDDKIYITKSGSCFGRLDKDSFAILDLDSNLLDGKPSKEYPLHLALYNANKNNLAVIHTHSLYSTIFSCMKDISRKLDDLFAYTPYLKMLTKGKISCVDYAKPGSQELFEKFLNEVNENTNVYILKNHGIVVSANDLNSAFNIVEEFEVSAKIQNILKSYDKTEINCI